MKRPSRRRPAPVALPPVLDLSAAGPLAASLLSRRGSALVLDGSAVERLGGQCLQVILAARQTWETDGHPFDLSAPSPAMSEALAALGAPFLAQTPILAQTQVAETGA